MLVGLVAGACSNDSNKKTTTTKPGDTEAPTGLYPASELNQAQHEGTPKRGGTAKFGLESAVLNISPNQSIIQPADLQLTVAVFDALVRYDDENKPTGEIAKSFSHSDDNKTWTVKLRDDVKFSNNVALDAEQVVSHTQWIIDSKTCSCDTDAQNIESVVATDPLTVVYTLKAPNVAWPSKLASGLGWITEQGARNEADNPASPDANHLIGTGAFKYEGPKVGDTYTVVRNEYYWGTDPDNNGAKLPYLDKIEFKPLADAVTRTSAVQSGGVHIMQTADTSNLVAAKKDKSLVVQPISGSSSTILVLNLTNKPFGVETKGDSAEERQARAKEALDDPDAHLARTAFATGINRNEINQKYYQGARVPAYGFIPADNPYFDKKGELPRYNPVEAKKLIAKYVESTGTKPEINAICIPTPESNAIFTILKDQGESIGIKANMKTVEQAVMVQTLLQNKKTPETANWNVACFRSPQIADPDDVYGALHSTGVTNLVAYSRDNVDEALDKGRSLADFDKRKPYYDLVQEQLAKDAVYIPLLFDYYGNVHRTEISGLGKPRPDNLGLIPIAGLYFVE